MARILLVDDEKLARSMYGDYLRGAGHDVDAAESVEEAKRKLDAQSFDLVVTDLLMPQGDGMSLLQYAKDNFPDIEVVVITALDRVDPAVRAIKSGAAEYLIKPVSAEGLAHAVGRTLTTRRLVKENDELREHLARLETGQRVATTLERARLVTTAAGAYAQLTHADGVVLFLRPAPNEPLRAERFERIPDALHGQLHELFTEAVNALQGGAAKTQKLTPADLPEPYEVVYAVPVFDGPALLACAVLLYRDDAPKNTPDAANFLAAHLAFAVKNLGRFAEVEDLVYLDDLTHLFNLRYLDQLLERQVRDAAVHNRPFSLLFLDLDHFKSVNDAHGHLVGSKLLVEVGRVLKGCVRDDDVVCRYGGDEYVIVLRETDSGGALKVGERIRRAVEHHHFLAREGYSLSLTTCIGVASFPEHASDKATLLDFADRAMYRGKKGSRNIIYVAAKGLEATPAQRREKIASGQP